MDEADALYNVLKEIFLLLHDGDRRMLADYNLTIPRFYALIHLGQRPGISVSELSDLMFCDKSNITRLVQNMEAENLVQRQRHGTDRRVLCLYLSPQGDDLRRKLIEIHQRRNGRRFELFAGPTEQEELLFSLRKLKDTLQRNLEESIATGQPA